MQSSQTEHMTNKTQVKKHDDELWDALDLIERKRYNELTLKQAIKVIKRLQWEQAYIEKTLNKSIGMLRDCLL